MQIFMLWQRRAGQTIDPARVEQRMRRLFEPMFDKRPSGRILQTEATTGVYLELPIKGWLPDFLQEDRRGWALGLDYPIDVAPGLKAEGIVADEGKELLALAEHFQSNPKPLLRRLSPPYVLVWPDRNQPNEATWVQQDGLGLGQIFEYDDGHNWVITNKIFALKALGIDLQMIPEEWALRSGLGWFPFEMTGFRHLQALKPATRLRITKHEVTRERFEVLGDWLNGDGLSHQDSLELARTSLLDYVKAADPLWDQASAGLTGGMDSRAVVATLIEAGATDYYVRVRGRQDVNDVIVSQYLCDLANVPLRIRSNQALPPANLEQLRRSMTASLSWQAGHTDYHIVKDFLRTGKRLTGGEVNIMGHHGSIGRGFYIARSQCMGHSPDMFEDLMIKYLTQWMRPWIHDSLKDYTFETIRQAYRQADQYNLDDYDKVEFFYLYERTRRWGSGGQYLQCGKVIAPFIAPGNITASFAIPGPDRLPNPFHNYIVKTNLPAWADVPDQKILDKKMRKELQRQNHIHHRPPRLRRYLNSVQKRFSKFELMDKPVNRYRETGKRSYNNKLYWQAVGQPLIEEALKEGGVWTQIYDPDKTKANWEHCPDDLAIFYLLEQICKKPIS